MKLQNDYNYFSKLQIFFGQNQHNFQVDIYTHSYYGGFTIQVQQISQIEKTHSLSPCKMESPQDQLQGELDYESVHPSYLKRP